MVNTWNVLASDTKKHKGTYQLHDHLAKWGLSLLCENIFPNTLENTLKFLLSEIADRQQGFPTLVHPFILT